jgi:hypothetical protein
LELNRGLSMRADMHKVIVEREREGSNARYRRPHREPARDPADLPIREGMRRPHVLRKERKQLNENLGPLKKYLRRQVGRPWNTVYAEISRGLRPSSAVQQHVRDHIWDYVERHVTLGPKGRVFGPPLRRRTEDWTLSTGTLYVHPRTGLLAVVKKRGRP